jgi:hypothetical protein
MRDWKAGTAMALALLMGLAAAPSPVQAAIVVTAPAAKVTVKAAPDFASEVLHDRWDMNERTDLGWRIFNTIEQPHSSLTNISFAGGLFSTRTTTTDPNIFILDSGYLPDAAAIGKFGSVYPIDADKFTVCAIRMSISPPLDAYAPAQFFWSKGTIYGTVIASNTFNVSPGWVYYLIDIPALGTSPSLPGSWSGTVDSLRFDPLIVADKDISIDWVRLVQKGTDYERTITWTGATGAVDIYLDGDTNAGNGNLGLLVKGVSGGSFKFLAGALAAGSYYIAIAPTGTTSFVYSAGYYDVTEQPILRIDKPSAKGSDQDFITVAAGDPWDMANAADVDYKLNINNSSFTTIDYQDLAGRPFTGRTVFKGESAQAPGSVGDPTIFFLNFAFRGGTYQIDTSRYHNLTAKLGIAGTHSTADGSIARVMWKRTDESVENVSQDIIIRHLPGTWIMHEFTCDLRTLPLEPGAGSPSHSGWTGLADCFRIDPHEFPNPREFFIDDVRITADERADASFPVGWTFEDGDTPSGATMAFYYDTDRTGYDGTLIAQNIAVTPGSGTYTWNTSGVPAGTYFVYAVVGDGLNANRFYATGPLVISHIGGGIPSISLSKAKLNFGSERYGTPTTPEAILLTNSGTGTLTWTAIPSQDWITVTPASGTGNKVLTVGIGRTDMAPGTYTGTVTVSDPNALNSPQVINVTLRIYGIGTDALPFGVYETPANGSTVSSSIAVTGWALDDVEVTAVRIYRNPLAGEPTQPNGQVFVGDAVFIQGARPDVEAAYPNYPRYDKAGWGYMMLTNFLPNGGNGTFQISAWATDRTGHEVSLGTRTIVCDNAHAVKPFGAIDTPAQGGLASGNPYNNFGWALTPQPKSIPTDGSTITVYVDGVALGHPSYNHYRSDIATLFPGYANSDGAVGVYGLDTTAFANGVHTVAWSVMDSSGQVDGIGSRFFTVQNTGGTGTSPMPFGAFDQAGGVLEDRATPVFAKLGFGAAAAVPVDPGRDGTVRVQIPQLGRVAIYLDREDAIESVEEQIARGRKRLIGERETLENGGSKGAPFSAYLVANGKPRPLPVGSTFDLNRGVLYWQAGPGFLGDYQFIFVRNEDSGPVTKSVDITILRK